MRLTPISPDAVAFSLASFAQLDQHAVAFVSLDFHFLPKLHLIVKKTAVGRVRNLSLKCMPFSATLGPITKKLLYLSWGQCGVEISYDHL